MDLEKVPTLVDDGAETTGIKNPSSDGIAGNGPVRRREGLSAISEKIEPTSEKMSEVNTETEKPQKSSPKSGILRLILRLLLSCKRQFGPRVQKIAAVLSSPALMDKTYAFIAYGLLALTQAVPKLPHSRGFAAAAALISDVRIFHRLTAVPQWANLMFQAIRGPQDTQWHTAAKFLSLLCYQPLENVWYLARHGIVTVKPETSTWLFATACKFWFIYTVLELARLAREWWKGETSAQWWKEVLYNGAYFPLTIHWSSNTGGFLSPMLVGVCGCLSASGFAIPTWYGALMR